MLRGPAAILAIPFLILLLMPGCAGLYNLLNLTANHTITQASCNSQCIEASPHSVGQLINGGCSCRCEAGYAWYGSICVTLHDYDILALSDCDKACKSSYPNSRGMLKEGNCTCPCMKAYVYYNRTCISQQDVELLSPLLCPADHPVLKFYDWSYKGIDNYIYLCYEEQNLSYASIDRSYRTDYWNFVNDPASEGAVSLVTDLLTNISGNEALSQYEQVEFAIAFVQSLPYTYDNVSTPYDNYPRFPSETIYADGGDCEDTAILMAAILRKMGYDVVLLGLPHHLATGVACNPQDFDYNATYYPYDGKDYCYLETTGENYKIGELPASFSPDAEVIPIPPSQPDLYIKHGYAFSSTSSSQGTTYIKVTNIHVDNFGTEEAEGVVISVGLEKPDGSFWDQYDYSVGSIPAAGYYDYNVTGLRVPTWEQFRVAIAVSGDNFKTVEKESEWAEWH